MYMQEHTHEQQTGFMDADSELQNNVEMTTEEKADTGNLKYCVQGWVAIGIEEKRRRGGRKRRVTAGGICEADHKDGDEGIDCWKRKGRSREVDNV